MLLSTILISVIGGRAQLGSANSFMSDKTEIAVDLEVSGAEALCQTDDGYVWIAQYSGLTRYDSKEYVTYKNFEEDGKEYSIINVRALASKEDTLYVATTENVFVYQDYQFSCLDIGVSSVGDIILDETRDLLYVSSFSDGARIYDIKNGVSQVMPHAETGNINDIALDVERNNYFYQNDVGVYDKNGTEIYLNSKILDIYSYGDVLYMGDVDGLIRRYDMANGVFLSDIVVPDQINKILYSPADDALFVACDENGLGYITLAGEEPVVSMIGDLNNKSQLVDLMIDYQGNLWIASHHVGASGVSIITKNALLNLLHDDAIWTELGKTAPLARTVYAVERHEDILYIVAAARIYLYDLNQQKILPDNIIMETIDAYAEQKTQEGRIAREDANYTFTYSPKDVEIFNGKVCFAVSNIGLVEYSPASNGVKIYDAEYVAAHLEKTVGSPDLSLTSAMRALRNFGTYLGIGYSRGVMKFDGTKFSVMYTGSRSVLFLDKSKDGKMIYDQTIGLFEVDDDFTKATEIPTVTGVSGNRLKFLVDGDYIYFTMNSRLFRLEEKDGKYTSKEIAIPFVKGSLLELSKIEYTTKDGEIGYRYVIASQSQIYITDSLEVERLEDYELYDSTNGLEALPANSSGYYDREFEKYYFQTTNGIFVYDFNEKADVSVPVKIDVASVELDGTPYFGNTINIKKDVYRVKINLSVFGFKPNKGYSIHYKLDGIDDEYQAISDTNDRNINYTNLPGGSYVFHAFAVDEYGQQSNRIDIQLTKEMKIHEHIWFWIVVAVLALSLVAAIAFFIIRLKTRQALKKQLEYKNITVESIQAIARTIDAKDEYTNGHSTRVGYYSKLIAENLGMSEDEVDNIYYIALLHDIGKIAIPDKILNKPGRLTDEEFAIMKSHTTRGAKILKGISTIPHIVEGAKSHHEKYDGTGYPEGLKGEEIPFIARIICCADCFDAMASKRVYKESFSLDTIISEFERCSGTQFDPKIAKVVVEMMKNGKLKPYTVESTYLGEDGKTHRFTKSQEKDGESA